MPALLIVLQRWPLPAALVTRLERRWLNAGLVFLTGLLILVSWPLLFGSFTLQAYF